MRFSFQNNKTLEKEREPSREGVKRAERGKGDLSPPLENELLVSDQFAKSMGFSKETPKVNVTRAEKMEEQLSKQASNNELLISHELATLGVRLSFLKSLPIASEAEFQAFRDHVMEMTRETQGNRSLAAYLLHNEETRHLVGKADYFVSYAWSGGVGDTMEALTKHFEGKSDPFLWMDVAMVDQHAAATVHVDFRVLASTFGDSLRKIGAALLVLTPGEKPIAIERSWCCFEWVSIKQSKIPFQFCVKPKDVEKLINRMEQGMGSANFNDLFAGINVEKAEAKSPSDKAAILALMKELGIKEVNDVIMFSLKNWLLDVAMEAEKRATFGTHLGTNVLNAKASLHDALGEFDQAMPLAKRALESARLVLPEDPGLVATMLNNLASLLSDKGDYDGAEPLYREAIGIWKKALGNDHPNVSSGLNNLAWLLKEKGQTKEASKMGKEALGIYERKLGPTHPNTVACRKDWT